MFKKLRDSSSESSGKALLDRVRRSVRSVVPCNVFLTDPLMGYQNKSSDSLFDVIITTLCLEFASPSPIDYSAALTNVARLLRPSGHLIIQVYDSEEKDYDAFILF